MHGTTAFQLAAEGGKKRHFHGKVDKLRRREIRRRHRQYLSSCQSGRPFPSERVQRDSVHPLAQRETTPITDSPIRNERHKSRLREERQASKNLYLDPHTWQTGAHAHSRSLTLTHAHSHAHRHPQWLYRSGSRDTSEKARV